MSIIPDLWLAVLFAVDYHVVLRHNSYVSYFQFKELIMASVLKSNFRRSDNENMLKQSGFFDARKYMGAFICSNYAPSSHQAFVPKKLDVFDLGWVKGKFGQENPVTYTYSRDRHGWIRQ